MLHHCVNGYKHFKGIHPHPHPPPSIFQDLMPHELCITENEGRMMIICVSHSRIHCIVMCRMWRFLAVLSSFFHSSLLCTFSCHPSQPTICPSSLTLSCYVFLSLPLNLVTKFIYNTLLGIIFSSVLWTCPLCHAERKYASSDTHLLCLTTDLIST
jgi:hypothetical protein